MDNGDKLSRHFRPGHDFCYVALRDSKNDLPYRGRSRGNEISLRHLPPIRHYYLIFTDNFNLARDVHVLGNFRGRLRRLVPPRGLRSQVLGRAPYNSRRVRRLEFIRLPSRRDHYAADLAGVSARPQCHDATVVYNVQIDSSNRSCLF
jgi:hypothetical protein